MTVNCGLTWDTGLARAAAHSVPIAPPLADQPSLGGEHFPRASPTCQQTTRQAFGPAYSCVFVALVVHLFVHPATLHSPQGSPQGVGITGFLVAECCGELCVLTCTWRNQTWLCGFRRWLIPVPHIRDAQVSFLRTFSTRRAYDFLQCNCLFTVTWPSHRPLEASGTGRNVWV